MAKEMLINVSEGEECRIALMEDGRLEELYMERTSSTSHVGNIYKGRVTNVEASIQAAFVDFGLGRNGFLHISDLMPTYFGRKGEDIVETVGKKMARRDRPPIQRCLRRGDEIIVQIIKEGIGTKGPTLSSYLSIPGKYLVMMPGVGKMGVSQKIEDEVERRRLRQILDGLKPPKDVGFIIRTAGVGKSKAEIERDLKYLTRLWEQLEKKRIAAKGPAELYAEGDLVTRTVRDFVSADVDRIVVDNADVADRVREVIKITTPRAKDKVELYDETVPLFHKYGIEREIEQMYSRHVPLPSGGSLVIDSTEAIVAIDVNSGKFREHNDAEMTAFKTDMEAADEIPRQLKLRDLGGVIICDFIDLRYERNRRELEKRLHDNFKNDRAKTKVLRMSQFGIIEMTRQRMRPSLKRSIYFDCPHCKGAGLVKTPESMSLDVMRRISIAINDLKVSRVELAVCPDVAFYLQNKKRLQIAELERQYDKRVLIRSEHGLGLDEMKLELFDSRDGLVMLPELDAALSQPPHKTQLNTRPHGRQQAPAGQGRGQGGGGGKFDSRRDQGRRAPQHAQPQGRGGPPQGRRDEEEARMEDRFELDEQEAEETPAESDRGGGEDRPARDARQDRGGGDRPRQEQGGRQDRGGRGDRGGRDDRGGNRGDRGGRPQPAQPAGGNGPAREGRHPNDRGPQRGNERGGRPREDDREFNGAPLAPAGETQQRGPGEAGGPGGPEGEGGEGGEGGADAGAGAAADAAAEGATDSRTGSRCRSRAKANPPTPTAAPAAPNLSTHATSRAATRTAAEDDDERGYPSDEYDNGDVDRSEPLGDAPGEIVDEDGDDDREEASRPAARGRGGDEAVSYIVEEPVIEADGSGMIVSDGVEKTAYGDEPGAALEADAADDEAAAAEPPAAEAPAKASRRRGSRGGSGRTAGGSRRTAAKAEQPAPAPAEPAPAEAEAGTAAAKPRRRGTRGGRGRGRKAGASETAAGATAEQSAAAAEPSPAPAPSTRRRAGSADKHLISDDPIIPEPVRRPRSSRDLDEIPDDLD